MTLWDQAVAGTATAVVGTIPPAPRTWREVRVSCAGPTRALGPLLRATDAVVRVSGAGGAWPGDRVRRRLSNDGRPMEPGGELIAELNRLAEVYGERTAIVLEDVDYADRATLALLARVIARPGWLKPALFLSFRNPKSPAARELLEMVDRLESPDPHDEAPEPPVTELRALPSDVRRMLRAAATVGDGFEVDVVAELLATTGSQVLLLIQDAVDLGVPVRDLGDGTFRLPTPVGAMLREGTLPSLRAHWNRELATLLAEPDAARAAFHQEEVGEHIEAVRAYIAAARQATPAEAPEALASVDQALRLLDDLPQGQPTTLLRGSALVERGRLLWAGAERGYTLDEAHRTLERADAMLSDASAALRAEVRSLLAAVLYDRGDDASLQRALQLLTTAIQGLTDEGRAQDAATLLNDQAAIWVRLGDPVRAAHLLHRSRELFEDLDDTPTVRRERAETLHLLARLPLHVRSREGQEADALGEALAHAHDASVIFRDLGLARELGRTLETRGRLLLARGDVAGAREALTQAFQSQKQSGDLVGLARSAAGLATLLADAGRTTEALELLQISIGLNDAKGSPAGLAFNRQALADLAASSAAEYAPAVDRLHTRIAAAERRWGPAHPPE